MKRYLYIWWKLVLGALQTAFVSRFGIVLFLVGKILRFGFFLFFLVIIGSQTKLLGTYSLYEMVLFYLTFNLIDTLAQLLFRQVYSFRGYVISGDFDYFLVKPISPLFRGLLGGSDAMDFPVFIMLIGAIVYVLAKIPSISWIHICLYVFLILNSMIIALAFHIFILSVGVMTTEVDNAMWLYRDLTQMGRVPVDIYAQPFRGIVTFAIPVGIMMTFPAKAILGLLSLPFILISFLFGVVVIYASMVVWRYALSMYASASS